MRRKRRGTLLVGAALSGILLFGCAVQRKPPLAINPTVSVPNGTVLIVRTEGFAGVAGGLAERAQLVRDIDGESSGPIVPLVEVVVRRDDGRMAAVLESPDDAPYPGQRVLLVNGSIVRDTASAGR